MHCSVYAATLSVAGRFGWTLAKWVEPSSRVCGGGGPCRGMYPSHPSFPRMFPFSKRTRHHSGQKEAKWYDHGHLVELKHQHNHDSTNVVEETDIVSQNKPHRAPA